MLGDAAIPVMIDDKKEYTIMKVMYPGPSTRLT